jgi:tetratricopeptide (TPR) repeat protein
MLARHALSRTGLYAATLVVGLSLGIPHVHAVGTDTPAPSTDKKKEKDKKSMIDQQRDYAAFLEGYRAARALILAGHYEDGIAAMHALHRDSNPDVANYIGYANRKLGNYDQSRFWYEAALKADPNHARTWSYYGMWHAEQGNRLKAEDFLQKVKLICGSETCTEFQQLRAVIDGKASY